MSKEKITDAIKNFWEQTVSADKANLYYDDFIKEVDIYASSILDLSIRELEAAGNASAADTLRDRRSAILEAAGVDWPIGQPMTMP
jgi:hypothetical protein